MDPVEINAGSYYLRQLRSDERMDDRAALIAAFDDDLMRQWVSRYRITNLIDADEYITERAQQWAKDLRCSWAVAEPTTGNVVGEVGLAHLDLTNGTAEASCWVAPDWRGRGVAATALAASLRFGYGALGLRRVDYIHAEGNTASRRVAQKCGFAEYERRDGLVIWRHHNE
ncbi:MAG TPA: GNAT family N-acetyltransferase [Pseudonocardiaceae bacterium]|nr:GNAT family N-acetyltransferase [Pseudonocardiaceae bacterium]